ncbi:MAG: aconitate hydratase [Candidatus Thermoplasmatota archaeon]|nr:aconitate hydratase [Candidatus Thermoplasmatota archaeon]
MTLVRKILEKHLVEGKLEAGSEISIRIDQTLTQDATGTMACLEFEAMDIPRVKTELSVSYVDHNTLQTDFRNADDHRYLQSIAARYGLYFSRPGNGICHQLHLERFACPGKTLLGSDSHTPTAGGVGSLAIGAGGLNVAAAMAGETFTLKCPEVVGIRLTGRLPPWVSAKDVILELLRRVGVKGGMGKVFEYFGPGVKTLGIPERATITNMGTETGATTSIFPSDEVTRKWFEAQDRLEQWAQLEADDEDYDEIIEINLSELEPMVALPHSPGNVKPVKEIAGMEVQQVAIGSCTNSSLRDMKTAAQTLKGHTVAPNLVLLINPGSRQVVGHLVESGEYNYLVNAGARIIENACGPCIGMGGAPPSASVSVRTYNRNFEGRSGTKDAGVFLVSPETAAATAVKGVLTDPRDMGIYPDIKLPDRFIVNDNMIIPPLPPEEAARIEIIRGPNIKPLPEFTPLPEKFEGEVLIKVGDNITTDHIMPAGAKILPLRSNIPEISKYVFSMVDPEFYNRAMEKRGGFIIGGENYGQGSSREHAAIAPKYLGIKAVIAKSFARIHRANLINFGIVPLTFVNADDYDKIDQGDKLEISVGLLDSEMPLKNITKGEEYRVKHDLGGKEKELMVTGGLLPWIKKKVV